jgi:hypothetical protein
MINLFKKNRYFVITFQWEMSKSSGYGELSRVSKEYPNRDFIQLQVLEQRKTLTKCIITNVRELSKKDFTSYCGIDSNK